MVEVDIEDAIDEAEYVKVSSEFGQVVQVWYGGTQVRVFSVVDGVWNEVTIWTAMDEIGEPLPKEEYVEMMEMKASREEDWW